MKETVRASLAGIGFVFDKDAFELLENYHDKLSAAYGTNPDGEEIINDIEARMVEIILSRQNSEQVVNKATVEEVVGQLGTPEIPDDDAPYIHPQQETVAFPRRLYRNLDGAKLGGVCNGMASYFDVDPVFVRVAMAVPLFLLIIFPSVGFHTLNAFLGSLFGAICLLYVIMWFAVPAAKTPRQKLEMQGRRVTASDIEREMAVSHATHLDQKPPQSAFARLFSILGMVLLFGVKFILLIIGFSFAIAALALFVGLVGLLLGASWVTVFGWEHAGDLVLGHSTIPAVSFAAMVLAVILIPLVMLVYQMIRVMLNKKNNPSFMWILGGVWILLTIFATITALSNEEIFRDFRGGRYELRHSDNPATGEGWEIYERNAQAYRDSIERAGSTEMQEPSEATSPAVRMETPGAVDWDPPVITELEDTND